MNIVLKVALGFVFVTVAGFGVGSSISAPNHAIVYIDEASSTYLSPFCIPKGKELLMPQMTISDARELTLKSNRECVNQGGFVQEGRSLTGKVLEAIGILSKQESRWNSDGSWKW